MSLRTPSGCMLGLMLAMTPALRAGSPADLIRQNNGIVVIDSHGDVYSVDLSRTQALDSDLRMPGRIPPAAVDISFSKLTSDFLLQNIDPSRLRTFNATASFVNNDVLAYLAKCHKLRRLYLSHARINNEGLLAVADFPRLESLSIGGRDLWDSGVTRFLMAASPLNIRITESKCDGGFLDAAGVHKYASTLEVFHSPITDHSIAALGGSVSLASICLDNTRVSDSGIERLQGISSLRSLRLTSNKISGAALRNFRRLEELIIFDENLSAGSLGGIATLTSLNVLAVRGQGCGDAVANAVKDLPSLRDLHLHDSGLSDEAVMLLRRAPALKTFGISQQTISREFLGVIAQLPLLSELSLRHSTIERDSLRELLGKAELRVLDLSGSDVTDNDIDVLRTLRLTKLNVSSTHISREGISRLKDMYRELLLCD